jgi:putative tryptophan/tyrosine transport system substrate-binding protein
VKQFWILDFRFWIGNSKSKKAFCPALCAMRLALSLVGTVLFALSFPSEAQQPKKVGILTLTSDDPMVVMLRQGLRELGYVEGQNIVIEHRFAEGKVDRLPDLAAELVHMNVDVIVARATPVVQAAKNATSTIPVVIHSADPVGSGFVASLARPGGNITGLSSMAPELAGKRLELLREILPKLSRVAFLAHGSDPAHRQFIKEAQETAERFGMKFQPVVIRGPQEFEDAFSAMARERAGALVVQPLFTAVLGQGGRIADLATRNRLLSISDPRRFAEGGGLISYGPDFDGLYRRAATYVDRILKGTKPADLPVQQPTKFELVINLKTAKRIGLTIPESMVYRADKVIK